MRAQLPRVFTPGSPVARREMVAGRQREIERAISAVGQVGRHAAIFGDRGVGKTTIAKFIDVFWNDFSKDQEFVLAARYSCDSTDTYGSIWAGICDEVQLAFEKREEASPSNPAYLKAVKTLQAGDAAPNSVRRFLELSGKLLIITVDEFDAIMDSDTVQMFADTIKILADHLVDATLVIVGVADTIDQLLTDHESIDRSLVQILMPPMKPSELCDLVQQGLDVVGMQIAAEAADGIAHLAQGYPYYAHLLGLKAGYAALDRKSLIVDIEDVEDAIREAADEAHESLRTAYSKAVFSKKRKNLFAKVLLACALAPCNDLGFFSPVDARKPLQRITDSQINVQTYIQHITKFTQPKKGSVLQVTGEKYARQYRFSDPLLKPYALIRGVRDGLVPQREWRALTLADRDERHQPPLDL